MEYIWPGIIAAQAIYAAAKLGIADLLASGPKTIAELTLDSGAHPPTLERLLRALVTLEMFAPTADGRFRNTPLSETLRSDHPQSLRDGALFLPAPFLWRPLGELYESVRTGEPAFQRIFGQHFFGESERFEDSHGQRTIRVANRTGRIEGRHVKRLWHDTDDRVRKAIQANRLADDCRIAAELLTP